MNHEPAERVRNRLLSRLLPQDYERLLPHLKSVDFENGHLLYEAHANVDFVYFPFDCVLSAITILEDGTGIEVGTIGNEGAAGLTAFIGPSVSPTRVVVQVPGAGMRIAAPTIEQEAKNNRTLYDLLLRHHHAFLAQMTQSVACNGVHPLVKRCCRWLLMTHDRVGKDELPLTHEFLAFMLAVRRPGVTETLHTLQEQGLITNSRGTIQITNRAGLEAASCECYRVVQKEYNRLLGSGNGDGAI
jgi:CRP-like cAMP-binding protein